MNSLISIDNMLFRWQDHGPHVLDIASFSIDKKERVFIKGASGSGKSTLLGLMGGVMPPIKGTIRVLDKELNKLSSAERDVFRADHIGFIFQMFNLIPYLSVEDNVTLPCMFSKLRRKKAENRSGSLREEARMYLSHLGMEGGKLLAQKVTDLSMGQQQRVAAARALMGSPDIIIADEPTSSLDADTRESFLKLLFRECDDEGITLVFVSHDASLETFFDRVFSLNDVNQAALREETLRT